MPIGQTVCSVRGPGGRFGDELSGVELSGDELSGVELSRVELSRVELSPAGGQGAVKSSNLTSFSKSAPSPSPSHCSKKVGVCFIKSCRVLVWIFIFYMVKGSQNNDW